MPCRHWNSYCPAWKCAPAMAWIVPRVSALWVANCGKTTSVAASSLRAQAM